MKFRRNVARAWIWMIFFYLIMVQSTPAQHNQYLFDQANKHYQQENYQQAIAKYLEIIKNGHESWQLYYNLGNACYKTRQIGRAILNFERALKLNPKNEDIEFNLQMANLAIVDKIVTPPPFILTKWFTNLKTLWGIQTLTFLGLGFYLLIAILITIKILWRRSNIQRLLTIVLIPMVLLFLIIASLLIIRIHENNTLLYAIVVVDKIDVLSSPDNQGTELFSLHEGVKFKVEEIRGEWAKIRLADGNVGWVKREVFEII